MPDWFYTLTLTCPCSCFWTCLLWVFTPHGLAPASLLFGSLLHSCSYPGRMACLWPPHPFSPFVLCHLSLICRFDCSFPFNTGSSLGLGKVQTQFISLSAGEWVAAYVCVWTGECGNAALSPHLCLRHTPMSCWDFSLPADVLEIAREGGK